MRKFAVRAAGMYGTSGKIHSSLISGLIAVLLCFGIIDAAYADDVQYVYDAAGRLIGVADPSGNAARYNYDAAGNIASVERIASSSVSILGLSPTSGSVGATVTITGTGFSATASQNSVSFNGTSATVSAATTTRLTVQVPSGATTGPVAVSAPAGSATSSQNFTVTGTGATAGPTITSFTPTIGNSGTSVTVSGANFQSDPNYDNLSFNNTSSSVSSASASQLTTSVPVGAVTGPITVATPYGSAASAQNFVVPPPSVSVSSVSVVGQMAIGDTTTYAITSPNTVALITFNVPSGVNRISFRVTSSSLPSGATLTIYDPNNRRVTSGSYSSVPAYLSTVTPTPGTYSLVVSPTNGSTGSFTLQLLNASDILGALTVGGASGTFTTTAPGQQIVVTFQALPVRRSRWSRATRRFPLPRRYVSTIQAIPRSPAGSPIRATSGP